MLETAACGGGRGEGGPEGIVAIAGLGVLVAVAISLSWLGCGKFGEGATTAPAAVEPEARERVVRPRWEDMPESVPIWDGE